MAITDAQPNHRVQTATQLRVGILGGTFDPIHIGHLIIAEEVWARLGLDTVLFVPARMSPMKIENQTADAEHRLAMVQIGITGNPHFAVSLLELEREGPSYTVDTLRQLRAVYGEDTVLHFIMGADSLHSLPAWYRPQEIIQLARIVAVSRPEVVLELSALESALPGISQATDVLSSLRLGISSTDIRARVRQGLPVRYQLPDGVEAYIRAHGLYAATEETPAARTCHR